MPNGSKKTPHEVERVLVLSTGHITHNDSKLLDKKVIPCTCYDFGYLLYVGDKVTHAECREDWVGSGISVALYHLFFVAREQHCTWLKLDADGPLRDDLPRFEW
jgi:hypothetical protein